MFDWFRKKKKSESESPTAEETIQVDDIEDEGPSPLVVDDSNQPEDESSPAEAIAEQQIEEAPPESFESKRSAEENDLPEPEAEKAAEDSEQKELEEEPEAVGPAEIKKGFFARFREKLSGGESDSANPLEAEEKQAPADVPAEPEKSAFVAETELSAASQTAQCPAEEKEAFAAFSPVGRTEIASERGEQQDEESEGEAPVDATSESMAQEEEGKPEAHVPQEPEAEAEEEGDEERESKGIFSRFKERLAATRNQLAGRIENLLSSVRSIDDDLLDELEELLITSDLGIKTTEDLLYKIRGQVASKELSDVEALKLALKKRIREMVDLPHPPRPKIKPMVIMVVGINGVGKTTTIAKLARRFKEDEGQKVLLAAGDTFRSAAVDQLVIWAERLGVEIVSQPTGSDASAVVFDALNAAQARGSDVVVIDTAGRLHTKVNLMDELKKIKRVANKAFPGAPHHTILVLDGNTGQNALRQAQTFHEAVGVDSIIVTKLDGTAKGGVIVSICNELKIPIAFVGLGESFEDLQPFDPEAFTEAILAP